MISDNSVLSKGMCLSVIGYPSEFYNALVLQNNIEKLKIIIRSISKI